MAEVQRNTEAGEMTQRFIEFVMMQAQNAALFLGQIPNPQTGKAEVNLDVAKMFIDQLAMIRTKTDGNLNNDETTVLKNAISNLQMAYVEVSQSGGGSAHAEALDAEESSAPVEPKMESEPAEKAPIQSTVESDSKKKFTKSYGS